MRETWQGEKAGKRTHHSLVYDGEAGVEDRKASATKLNPIDTLIYLNS